MVIINIFLLSLHLKHARVISCNTLFFCKRIKPVKLFILFNEYVCCIHAAVYLYYD
jgi:hypothetical protein